MRTAHIVIAFRVPATIPVTVRIVGATGDPACPRPDLTVEACPTVSYGLTATAPGTYDFAMALPAGCCLTGDAFVEVGFPGSAYLYGADVMTTGGFADFCHTYVTFGGSFVHPSGITCPATLCACASGHACADGDALVRVETECCEAVLTLPSAWGTLKVRYR